MSPALLLTLLWALFALTHIVPTSAGLRPKLVARIGTGPYLGLYSLVSLTIFVPLVTVYVYHLHEGPQLWTVAQVPGVREMALALAGLGFTVMIASFFQKNPLVIGIASAPHPSGLTRITRHPMFLPAVPIAMGHLLLHGWLTDVVFFSGLGLYAIAGCLHQDHRKRLAEGEKLAGFFTESSFLPFAAILAGRGRLVLTELPWLGLVIGAAAAFGFYRLHPVMFG